MVPVILERSRISLLDHLPMARLNLKHGQGEREGCGLSGLHNRQDGVLEQMRPGKGKKMGGKVKDTNSGFQRKFLKSEVWEEDRRPTQEWGRALSSEKRAAPQPKC